MNMYTLNQVPSEAQIRKFLRKTLFGSHLYCPWCKSRNVVVYQERYRCRKCLSRFSLTSHTWLNNCKLSLPRLWLVLWCWTTQVPVKQTMALTELSEPTVRLWFDTFRHQLPEEETILDHLVQLDEAYFGGKKKTTTLFMAKQVSSLGERKLAYQLIKGGYPKREHAWWFVETYLKPYTALFTDGASIYKEIDQWWPLYHSRDIQKSLSLSRLQRLKGCLGYYELSLEECIIMLPMTSYRLLWVNSVTDLAIQKCLKIRDTMQKYHLSL